jgi:hypothetical protein
MHFSHDFLNQNSANQTQNQMDELSRIFNTALVATRTSSSASLSDEVYQMMNSPAFRSILVAVRQLSLEQGITEQCAAEEVIRTFRKIDTLWSEFVFQEGVNRLGSSS